MTKPVIGITMGDPTDFRNYMGAVIHQDSFNKINSYIEGARASDDAEIIASTVKNLIRHPRPQVILMTGGTGITDKDVTIEAVNPMFAKILTAFGSLFANLSFEEIGSAAFLSRATAGIIEKTVVFCMPGSINACKLACRKLIFAELGHLVKHLKEG